MLEKIEGGKAFVDNRQKKPDKNNKNSIQMIISILITSISSRKNQRTRCIRLHTK